MLVSIREFHTLAETFYEFGCFRLDPSEHRLLREDSPVALAPKAFEILVALISSHGHLVTREALMQTVWPDSFVEETNLTVNISLLRKVLGDSPAGQPWIATVPKRGYRFDGPVTLHTGAEKPPPEPITAAGPVSLEESSPHIPPPLAPAATPAPIPVANPVFAASPSAILRPKRNRWLFALAAAVIVCLGVWAGLRIFASHPAGSGQQRVLAAPDTSNPQARELYLEGRANWNKRSLESVRKSIEQFQQATNLDPGYAAAWSGLADAWILAGTYGNSFLAPSDAMPKAKNAALKALALDDFSAEAHTSLAYIHLMWDWDFKAAEQEFKRALEIDPGYVNAHHWYSHELIALGRLPESHEESERALGLDPTNVVINEHMAWHHLMAREYDRSIPQANKAIELDPAFVQAHRILALDLLYTGRAKEACAEFEKGLDLSHGDPVASAYLARCYALTHREADARRILTTLEQASTERYISAAEIAAVYAALNDSQSALKWLDKACAEHSGALVYLNADRVWDSLRGNPGFLADLQRVNLPALADETVTR
jgi:DNA-binding winged helix-turn-helix (wHTH) protein/Tfp pilus assembly protein PilF